MKTIRVKLMNLDGRPDVFGSIHTVESTKLDRDGEVAIYRNFDMRTKPIGVAKLSVEGNAIYAECRVLDGEPVAGAYPAAGGTLDGVEGNVVKSTINMMSFCSSPNVDERIEPVKEEP